MRILMVEDEVYLAEAVQHILERAGYTADLAHDGEDGLDRALSGAYDLIILDIMLPKLDGISILKRIRAKSMSVPVLMLSAKGETEDKVEGLDTGADDYLAKPFKTPELLARIRALSRREGKIPQSDTLHFGDIHLDSGSYELRARDKSFKLTSKEYDLLEALIKSAEKVVNKDLLFKKIWGNDVYKEDNYVEVYISFLRKKLTELKCNVVITTTRGVGYKLTMAHASAEKTKKSRVQPESSPGCGCGVKTACGSLQGNLPDFKLCLKSRSSGVAGCDPTPVSGRGAKRALKQRHVPWST